MTSFLNSVSLRTGTTDKMVQVGCGIFSKKSKRKTNFLSDRFNLTVWRRKFVLVLGKDLYSGLILFEKTIWLLVFEMTWWTVSLDSNKCCQFSPKTKNFLLKKNIHVKIDKWQHWKFTQPEEQKSIWKPSMLTWRRS